MAKYSGKVGYIDTVETQPGVWTDEVTEKFHYGDFTRNSSRFQTSTDSANDNVNTSNEISIIADPYAIQNFQSIRYVEFMGTKWKVDSVEVKYPRLILSIGGVWNG